MDARQVCLEELNEWFEAQAGKILQHFRSESSGLVGGAKQILEAIGSQAKRLRNDAHDYHHDPVVTQYAQRFAEKIVEIVEGVKFPDTLNHKELREFKDALERTIVSISRVGKTYISRLSKDFKNPVAMLELRLKNLSLNITSLTQLLEANRKRNQAVDEIRRKIESVLSGRREIEECRIAVQEMERQVQETERLLHDAGSRLEEISRREQLREWMELDKKLADLQAKTRNILSPLSKALRKIEKLMQDGHVTLAPESRHLLRDMQEDPYVVVSFPHQALLLETFSQVQSLIMNGSVKLDERKARKATETIQQIRELGILEKLNVEHQHIIEARSFLERNDELQELQKELARLRNETSRLSNQADQMRSTLKRERNRLNLLQRSLTDNIANLQEAIEELTQTRLTIKAAQVP